MLLGEVPDHPAPVEARAGMPNINGQIHILPQEAEAAVAVELPVQRLESEPVDPVVAVEPEAVPVQQITVRITRIFFLEMEDPVGHQVAVPEQPVLLQPQVVIIKKEDPVG